MTKLLFLSDIQKFIFQHFFYFSITVSWSGGGLASGSGTFHLFGSPDIGVGDPDQSGLVSSGIGRISLLITGMARYEGFPVRPAATITHLGL
ncbi:MAG: hypothetical protein PHI28_11410 [Mangrovibacterium sp.]|nr:hypothetical protein [Mangrovibacterium sp.]